MKKDTRILREFSKRAFCFQKKGIGMLKDKLLLIRRFVMKNYKIVLPVIVVAIVAFTVTAALGMSRGRDRGEGGSGESAAVSGGDESGSDAQTPAPEEIPLVKNEDPELLELLNAYYTAQVSGDTDALNSLYDMLPAKDSVRYAEMSKYLDHFAEMQVYTKQGPADGSVIAYVYYRVCFANHEEEFPGYENLYICRNTEGNLYIKNRINFTPEEDAYIRALNEQDDVAEFNNKVTVEYNDLIMQNEDLLAYLSEVQSVVEENVGLALADQNASGQGEGADGTESGEDQENEDPASPEPSQEPAPAYATATTTVNVRSSDSEQADKLGRVTAGTRVDVVEVGINGWTKVVYEGKDGFIKSEYLEFAESAAGQETVGTVTANTNINVRSQASQSSEKLGMLAGGESLDLLAVEGEWCKVSFGGQIGYVKAEFVSVQQN